MMNQKHLQDKAFPFAQPKRSHDNNDDDDAFVVCGVAIHVLAPSLSLSVLFNVK